MQKIIPSLQKAIIYILSWNLPRQALRLAVLIFAPRHRVGVAAMVVDAEKGVLLLNHVFHPTIPWGVPGGWLDAGESPIDGAKRELWEETGLTAHNATFIHMRHEPLPGHIAISYLMHVEEDIDPESLTLSKEIMSAAWFDVTQLPKLNPFSYESILMAAEKLQQSQKNLEHS